MKNRTGAFLRGSVFKRGFQSSKGSGFAGPASSFKIAAACLFAAAFLLLNVQPAFALVLPDEDPAVEDPNMFVLYNASDKWESNFNGSEEKMEQIISMMQPGDEAVFRVTCTNDHEETTRWYMENTVLKSLEDRNANENEGAFGGAYSYILEYTGPDVEDGARTEFGGTKTMFSSDTVGGLDTEAGMGLNQATINLDDWMYMGNLKKGEKGQVILHVLLEGETQGNDYQDTLADLGMRFSVEKSGDKDKPGPPSVQTGDANSVIGYIIASAAAGVLLIVFAVMNIRQRKRAADPRGREER